MPALFVLGVACASPPGPRPPQATHPGPPAAEARDGVRALAARTALAMLGTPYRYGGSSPEGFDCSGLVVFSYARAGAGGLPRTAAALERRARPIALRQLQPGDLLFFRLDGRRTSHVGVYVGDETFVHAPSSGRRVESVSFEHVYWSPRIRRAGRLEF